MHMFRTVAQLLPSCATGHPHAQRDVPLCNRLGRIQRNFARQVIRQPRHFIWQLQVDLTTYHKAAEFHKYIESAFSVDRKRNRSAVIHHACSQRIVAHLKGAASADENKAFLHPVYSLNAFVKPVRWSICMNR